MKKETKTAGAGGGLTGNAANPKRGFKTQEKTSVGGRHNSGVTSGNAKEKEEIEKKATLKKKQPPAPGKETW